MEFFGGLFSWTDLPTYIIQVMSIANPFTVATAQDYVSLMLRLQIITLAVAGGLYLVEHLMGGYALYVMAKRAGIKHGWIGFLPFGCTYLAGKLAGETRVFSARMKRVGLYTMLIEILFVLSSAFVLVLSFLLCRPEFYAPELLESGEWSGAFQFVESSLPTTVRWMYPTMQILGYINQALSFVVIFFFCLLFFALFRKYYPRSPFLMTFLCALLPVRGFVLFAVRNNRAVDYEAYVRRRMESMAPPPGYNPYGRQYGPQDNFDPVTGKPIHHGAPDPFSDFSDGGESGTSPSGSGDDSPFSDF